MATHAGYLQQRYFPALDGLRAVSVLMVISFHTGDPMWQRANGYLGVTIFFVISGFLITTLLLREENERGSVSLSAFFVRRVFRIVPLYYAALAVFAVLVIGMGLGSDSNHFVRSLPLFLTFNGEFSGTGTFSHSWSLGIEEKFYVVWPLLGFAFAALIRARGIIVISLLGVTVLAALLDSPWSYPSIYSPILAGVLIAVALDRAPWFRVVRVLALPPVAACLFLALGVAIVLNDERGYTHVWVGLIVASCLPCIVLSAGWARMILTTVGLRYIGRRSYAMYLFHPIVLSAVDVAVPPQQAVPLQIARLVAIVVATLVVAETMHRLVEAPMIRAGRRASRAIQGLAGRRAS